MSEGTFRPIDWLEETGPDFADRIMDNLARFELPSSSYWCVYDGDYGVLWDSQRLNTLHFGRLGSDLFFEHPRRELDDLIGSEKAFSNILSEHLSRRAHSLNGCSSMPVIAVDVGGGQGSTWRRLARNYACEISAGQLVLVVTNLENYSRSPEESDGVLFVNAHVNDLRYMEICVQGMSVPLLGNVDLLHERVGVTAHSLIPEYDMLRLAELVGPSGMWIPERYKANKYMDDEHQYARHEAIHQTIKYLTSASGGFTRVEYVEAGEEQGTSISALILKRPGAPLLNVD